MPWAAKTASTTKADDWDDERGVPVTLAELDAFLAWQDDYGATTACCLLSGSYEDDDAPDCDTCEYRQQTERLGPADHRALEAYRYLSMPVVKDLRLTECVGPLLGLAMTRRDAKDWLQRLNLIHRYRHVPDATATPEKDDD